MSKKRGCPPIAELERGYWERDEQIAAHVELCTECRRHWTEIEETAALRDALEIPSLSEQHPEEVRTALLARQQSSVRVPERRWRMPVAVVSAAAALLFVWWAWPTGQANSPPAQNRRAQVLAQTGAEYMATGSQPDEVLRLTGGTITVDVDPLEPGERFRVITGDAEIEVKGTSFDVTVENDKLQSVRVIHGLVEVRAEGAVKTLREGERWTRTLTASLDEPEPEPEQEPEPELEPASGPEPEPAMEPAPERPRTVVARRASEEIRAEEPDAGPPPVVKSSAHRAFNEAWEYLRANEYDDAAEAFERVMLFARDTQIDQDAAYWRAVALARGKRSDEARRAFRHFLGRYPRASRTTEAAVMFGWLLFDAKEYDDAKRYFLRAGPGDPEYVRESAQKGLRELKSIRLASP